MSDDFKVQISYKLGPNNSDMLNVRAGNAYELLTILDALEEEHGVNSITTIQSIISTGEQLRAVGNAAPLTQPQQGQQSAPQQSYQQPAARTSPTGESCFHGTYVWAEGVSKKTGKPYRMWKCPQPGTDCKPSFA